MSDADGLISLELVYMKRSGPLRMGLCQPAGTTLQQALDALVRNGDFDASDFAGITIGIFGKIVPRDELLRDGDRVEIYRGPAADAKAARRDRLKPAKRR